jgi:hypothetical protein
MNKLNQSPDIGFEFRLKFALLFCLFFCLTHQLKAQPSAAHCAAAGFVSGGAYSGGAAGICIWEDPVGSGIFTCSYGNSSILWEGRCYTNCPNATYYFGTGNAGRDYCLVVLPIQLIDFTVDSHVDYNQIEWVTATELNSSFFVIEVSQNGEEWTSMVELPAAGNSNEIIGYRFQHYYPLPTINYYRLIQVDINGQRAVYGPQSVDNREFKRELLKMCNTMGQEVTKEYTGIVIYYYDDGTTEKIYR